MSMLLSELVERLQADVPAEYGVPSEEQYQHAIEDAVRDFSERCGVEQIGSLSIVSGTATYDLPEDFLKLIKLTTLTGEGVLHSTSGQLIPVPATWCEKYTIRNGQITFHPIPRYTLTRDIYYKAAWILTNVDEDYGGGDYETLGEREARIVLLKARSIALSKQVNSLSGQVLKYSLGAVSIDKGSVVEEKRRKSETFEDEFEKACDKYNGQTVLYGA